MPQIQKNIDLAPYNTFRVSAKAKEFLVLRDLSDQDYLSNLNASILILGEGANILFTRDVDRLVIKNDLKGRSILAENDDSVILEVASGENWHDLVVWTVGNGWSGLENMAFIPGTIGAAAVGNIAAYGGHFEDVFESAVAVEISSGRTQQFFKKDLKFGYRKSVFSRELKDRFLVTSVTIKLSRIPKPETSYHSRYESLKEFLLRKGQPPYSPKQIAEGVTEMRLIKLPDWRKIGTAGSFFKNPVVKKEKALALEKEVRELQIYPAEKLVYDSDEKKLLEQEFVKVPVGRLLDELGWKGKRIGNVGTWPKHALTVINYGNASGQEILNFAQEMAADVEKNFGITLEPEVNICF